MYCEPTKPAARYATPRLRARPPLCPIGAQAPQIGRASVGGPATLAGDAPRFATRSAAQAKRITKVARPLVDLIRGADLRPVLRGEALVGEHVHLRLVHALAE